LHRYIRSLLKQASTDLVSLIAPRDLEGKTLAAYIASESAKGATPRELRESTHRLEEILLEHAVELAELNSDRAMGAILREHDAHSTFLNVLETELPTEETKYLQHFVQKGANYEIQQSKGK